MIRLRLLIIKGPPTEINPQFDPRANSVTVRSMSLPPCPPSGLTSTFDKRAADWIAPNWPILEVDVGSRMTPTRVTFGAISLSSSSHFASISYECREPGHVAARLRQAGNKASTDGIGNLRKYDRHSAGRLLQCGHRWSGAGKDDVRGQCHQFCCSFPQIAGLPTILNFCIATIDPTQSLQFVNKRRDPCLHFRIVLRVRHQDADASNPLGLLRARRKRPRSCGTAKKCDEIASSHRLPGGSGRPS